MIIEHGEGIISVVIYPLTTSCTAIDVVAERDGQQMQRKKYVNDYWFIFPKSAEVYAEDIRGAKNTLIDEAKSFIDRISQ